MNDLKISLALGALSGSRRMLGPSVAADHRLPGMAAQVVRMLAAGELIADKHPSMGARTDPIPFAGRIATGAIAAVAASRHHRSWLPIAAAGAAGAVASTLLLYHLRREISRRYGVSNVTAGIVEDLVALSAATWVSRRLAR